MNRLTEVWSTQGAVALRRFIGLMGRGAGRLLGMLLWQLRVVWARITPRARIVLIIIGLALLSRTTNSVVPSIGATLQALAVMLLAAVGFWLILTSPFRQRRWWGRR